MKLFFAFVAAAALYACSTAPTGPAASPAPSAAAPASRQVWAERVRAAVWKNIVLREDVPGNPVSEVDVWLGPQGYILNTTLVKSSGVQAWDKAVMNALAKTNRLPPDADGRVPQRVRIVFFRREGSDPAPLGRAP
jgi:TonB family protein